MGDYLNVSCNSWIVFLVESANYTKHNETLRQSPILNTGY